MKTGAEFDNLMIQDMKELYQKLWQRAHKVYHDLKVTVEELSAGVGYSQSWIKRILSALESIQSIKMIEETGGLYIKLWRAP